MPRILYKMKTTEDKVAFIDANWEDLLIDDDFLKELTVWLTDVSNKEDECHTVCHRIKKFVENTKSRLAQHRAINKEATARFMVEALRVCNFSGHSTTVIRDFIIYFKLCGIKIHGNPDACADAASFDGLDYSQGGVMMQLG